VNECVNNKRTDRSTRAKCQKRSLRFDERSCGPVPMWLLYRGADKSLARPGRKQATATEEFDFRISYL